MYILPHLLHFPLFMCSLYNLKSQFQNILRPTAYHLVQYGFSANIVTLFAMVCSLLFGVILFVYHDVPSLFLLLPIWMLLRMILNAMDGIMAKEMGQSTILGAYLNELSDVVSDAALYMPFVLIAPFGWISIFMIIFMSFLSEMAGAMGPMVGAIRFYDGPIGKSDRAFIFGCLGLWYGWFESIPPLLFWMAPLMVFGISVNIYYRIQRGIHYSPQKIPATPPTQNTL